MIDQIIANFSFTYLLLFLFVSFFLYSWYISIRDDREINSLGARAPILRTYLPFGMPCLQSLSPVSVQLINS